MAISFSNIDNMAQTQIGEYRFNVNPADYATLVALGTAVLHPNGYLIYQANMGGGNTRQVFIQPSGNTGGAADVPIDTGVVEGG